MINRELLHAKDEIVDVEKSKGSQAEPSSADAQLAVQANSQKDEKSAHAKLEMAKLSVKKNETAGIKRLKEIIDNFQGTNAAEEAELLLKKYEK